MPIRALIALFAAMAVAGCTHSGSGAKEPARSSSTNARSGDVKVVDARRVDARYIAGDAVYGVRADGRREKLAAGMNALLIATLSPAAVASPNGDPLIAYNSWRRTRPVLRLRDLSRDRDVVVDEGAYSAAWRDDGVLAHVKAVKPDLGTGNVGAYVGHVVVRPSPDGAPVRWTSKPGRYVVAAWAGRSLLVYRLTGRTWPDLLALDGRGKVRVLAKRGALIAVSRDGDRAFVSMYGTDPPVVRVLRVADGSEAASFDFGKDADATNAGGIRWLTESGSWVGDTVYASSSQGIVVFRVRADDIELEQVLTFDLASFPLGVFEPQGDDSGRRIVAWGQLTERPRQAVPDAAVLECDRVELRCKLGRPVSAAIGPRLVYNPSRP